jgi:hypothetical protein
MYNIYFLEENDNIRIVFDKLQLINDLVELYKKIGVIMLIVDANTIVSQVEKDMIMNILGNNSFKKRESINTRGLILDIIQHVQNIEICKSKIDNIPTKPVYLYKEKEKSLKINVEYGADITSPIDCMSTETMNIHFSQDTVAKCVTRHSTIGDENKNNLYNYSADIPVPKGGKLNIPIPRGLDDLLSHNDNLNIEKIIQPNDINYGGNYQYTYLIDSWWAEHKNETLNNSYCILYNQDNECSLVCNYTQKIKGIADEFGDFIILREYNNIPEKSVDLLKELIHNNMYCEKISIEKKLVAFESLYDVEKINQQEDEKSLIIFYIKQNYIISDDVNKRIKVSTLLEEVETELKISNTNLKYNFANYLYDIGLQKKRYSDGMYLYGIESKANAKINDLKKVKLTNKDYEKLIDSRDKELNEIYNSRTKAGYK